MGEIAETTRSQDFSAAGRTRRLLSESPMLQPLQTEYAKRFYGTPEERYHAEMREKQLLGYVILD